MPVSANGLGISQGFTMFHFQINKTLYYSGEHMHRLRRGSVKNSLHAPQSFCPGTILPWLPFQKFNTYTSFLRKTCEVLLSEAFSQLKIHQNAFMAGGPPRIPLGEFIQTPSQLGGGGVNASLTFSTTPRRIERLNFQLRLSLLSSHCPGTHCLKAASIAEIRMDLSVVADESDTLTAS